MTRGGRSVGRSRDQSPAHTPASRQIDIRTRQRLEAPLMPTLARFALPNVLVMLVQSSIGLIETYFVAGLGTVGLPRFCGRLGGLGEQGLDRRF